MRTIRRGLSVSLCCSVVLHTKSQYFLVLPLWNALLAPMFCCSFVTDVRDVGDALSGESMQFPPRADCHGFVVLQVQIIWMVL